MARSGSANRLDSHLLENFSGQTEAVHRRWDADVRVEDLNLEEIFVELGSDA